MTWRGYVLVLALLSVIAGGWWIYDRATTPPVPFPSDVLAIVKGADRVRAQEMKPFVGNPPPGAAVYENCSMVGIGKAIAPKNGWLASFRGIITDGRTYSSSAPIGSPAPKMVVRFAEGNRKVDVMLDFTYDAIIVQMDGKPYGTGDFGPRRNDLVRLAKVLFPENHEVQSLTASVN